ncbi:MAG: hypothetical protein Kow0059_16640 [Candidatus Sumerlaeia bacterium]
MPKAAAIYLSHLSYPTYALMTDDVVGPGDYCIVEYQDERSGKKTLRRTAYVGAIEGRASMQLAHVSLPVVVGRAGEPEISAYRADRRRLREALTFCKRWASRLNLNMKVAFVEPDETENKLTFYFTADKRVDFRELVKKLSAEHRCRIELWQIGNRDESRRLGGYGSCGMECCCVRGGMPREPITLAMMRDQDISLPPSQMTGACGRLRCCLLFEHQQYIEMGRGKPPIGSWVDTADGDGVVIDRNLLAGTFVVRLKDSGSIVTLREADIKGFRIPVRNKRECPPPPPSDAAGIEDTPQDLADGVTAPAES